MLDPVKSLVEGIPIGLRNENRRSSTDQVPNFLERLLSRNRLNFAGANFVPAPNRFSRPEPLNFVRLLSLQALDEFVGEQCP